MEAIKNRYDFIYLFDVEDGNPNGDPDAGNMPRIDAETGEGLVTDVCLKRKVRNYVQTLKNGQSPYDIFIKEGSVLNDTIADTAKDTNSKEDARKSMCDRFYDVRTFGAVMTTGKKNAGQVRGPIQLTFARSLSPIVTAEHTITRMAVTDAKDSNADDMGKRQTMGRKYTVPYGLYLTHGYISANLAKQTGFSEDDLQLFWDALKNMFDVDHSAARGMMCPRRLIVFRHDSELGNAPSHQLFDLVHVTLKDPSRPPRSFSDYEVNIDTDHLPQGVEMESLI
ncbi:MAG: type I-C CRISPR-associated protein Cas7/Csd2 [Prevotella sp.]|jgi:CRISPR-associated protein Csd2